MTDQTKPDSLLPKNALTDWPVSVHPRLGLGPTQESIFEWFCKYAAEIRDAVEAHCADKPAASSATLSQTQGETFIKSSGPAAAPLISRTKDEDGKPVVILAEWWYEQMVKIISELEALRVPAPPHTPSPDVGEFKTALYALDSDVLKLSLIHNEDCRKKNGMIFKYANGDECSCGVFSYNIDKIKETIRTALTQRGLLNALPEIEGLEEALHRLEDERQNIGGDKDDGLFEATCKVLNAAKSYLAATKGA